VIETFVPFPAGSRLRVLLVAFPVELMAQFATGALKDAAGTPSGGAFVVDGAGVQVAATGPGSKLAGVDEAVAAAARAGHTAGSVDGSRLILRRVSGTGLLVGLVAPEAELAAGLPSTLWPRLALAGFGLALVGVLVLTGRALRDARRLDAARRAADDANRAKTAFVGSVSHEVRTPLNTISGAAQILAGDEEAKPFARELAEDIRSSAKHLNEMLTDLIDISAIEQGVMRLTPVAVDVAAICAELANAARPLAAERHLTIEVRVGGLDGVVTDPSRLRQAVYNYLHNAIKFSPPGARITVTAEREPDETFRVEVANSGPPISPSDQQRLFTAFEQLDASQPGSGLGLAVTRRIVEAQGGGVGVVSAEGEETRFWLRLPLRPPVREPVAVR
jgi:signal transduction histidine kinase